MQIGHWLSLHRILRLIKQTAQASVWLHFPRAIKRVGSQQIMQSIVSSFEIFETILDFSSVVFESEVVVLVAIFEYSQ